MYIANPLAIPEIISHLLLDVFWFLYCPHFLFSLHGAGTLFYLSHCNIPKSANVRLLLSLCLVYGWKEA